MYKDRLIFWFFYFRSLLITNDSISYLWPVSDFQIKNFQKDVQFYTLFYQTGSSFDFFLFLSFSTLFFYFSGFLCIWLTVYRISYLWQSFRDSEQQFYGKKFPAALILIFSNPGFLFLWICFIVCSNLDRFFELKFELSC